MSNSIIMQAFVYSVSSLVIKIQLNCFSGLYFIIQFKIYLLKARTPNQLSVISLLEIRASPFPEEQCAVPRCGLHSMCDPPCENPHSTLQCKYAFTVLGITYTEINWEGTCLWAFQQQWLRLVPAPSTQLGCLSQLYPFCCSASG